METQKVVCPTNELSSSDASFLNLGSHVFTPKAALKEAETPFASLVSPTPIRPSVADKHAVPRSCPNSNGKLSVFPRGAEDTITGENIGLGFVRRVCSSFIPYKRLINGGPESLRDETTFSLVIGGNKRAIPEAMPRPKCNCKKSGCLKKYCECYKAGVACQGCNCTGCENLVPQQKSTRPQFTGCNCKKSGCSKKYCECFQRGLPCGDSCKCENCKNQQKVHAFRKLYEEECDLFGKQ